MLYIVATPIGNLKDITLRALEILKKVDFVICEEFKVGKKLLDQLSIQQTLYSINEHNEEENSQEILSLLQQEKQAALISDCGTPLFADPGKILVQLCHQHQIPISPIPGPSSLLAALSLTGWNINQFYYAGFLPRKREERKKSIQTFKTLHYPVILLDTPYRLKALLEDLYSELQPMRKVTLCLSLTQSKEKIIQTSLKKLKQQIQKNNVKQEFVMIIQGIK